jgi:predicted acyltransferase
MSNTASSQVSGNPIASVNPPRLSERLMSVDALRGFDMFWIIGADALVYAFKRMADAGRVGLPEDAPRSVGQQVVQFFATQLEHVEWAGFHFYDLIFPLFVFIMGVSLVFSLTKQVEKGGKREAMKRLFTRFLLMFAVALLYSGGFKNPWPDMRLLGVLNRIALCYLFGGLIFVFFRPKAIVGIAGAFLIGYWGLMAFVPFRNIQLSTGNLIKIAEGRGDSKAVAVLKKGENFSTIRNSEAWAIARRMYSDTSNSVNGLQLVREVREQRSVANAVGGTNGLEEIQAYKPGYNLANHIDFQFLPGKKWETYWDPEGIVSTLPAIVTCLFGIFAGLLLRSANFCSKWKLIYLFSFGLAAVLLGFLWGSPLAGLLEFPVIKKIWSSSFVLVAGGFSAILLGLFYFIVDVKQFRGWCQPFVWMGMNSITIYLASNLIGGFRQLAQRFVGGDVKVYLDGHVLRGFGDMVVAIVGLMLAFWFVRFLYKKSLFLRL